MKRNTKAKKMFLLSQQKYINFSKKNDLDTFFDTLWIFDNMQLQTFIMWTQMNRVLDWSSFF